eukprot:9500251-Pyramimonas_sp.AAC.2
MAIVWPSDWKSDGCRVVADGFKMATQQNSDSYRIAFEWFSYDGRMVFASSSSIGNRRAFISQSYGFHCVFAWVPYDNRQALRDVRAAFIWRLYDSKWHAHGYHR